MKSNKFWLLTFCGSYLAGKKLTTPHASDTRGESEINTVRRVEGFFIE